MSLERREAKRIVKEYVEAAREYAEEAMRACTRCMLCLDACTVYRATRDPRLSPVARLFAGARVLRGEKPSEDDLVSLYTCNLCGACTYACPLAIEVLRIVHAARIVLTERGIAPRELLDVKKAAERSGHSFLLDAGRAAKFLVETARSLGLQVENGDVLYVPSPFDTTLYPNLLRTTIQLLRLVAGDSVTVSARALDFGGNVGIDANSLEQALLMTSRVLEAAEESGARLVVLGACGADAKLKILMEKLGLRTNRLRVLNLYELLAEKGYRLECRDCMLYTSCTFARLGEPRILEATRARLPRDKPPYTLCCGGAGGLNFIHYTRPYSEIRRRVYRWRFERLAGAARGKPIIVPCVKCYTVFRTGALLAKKPGYPLRLYPELAVERGSASQP